MAHTNRVRVVLGGLLAGVVINIVEFITNGVVLKADWGQAMQALGKSPVPSGSAIAIYNVWGFLVGIAAVWIYAAIRPRSGGGPKTAAVAGFSAFRFSLLCRSPMDPSSAGISGPRWSRRVPVAA